MKWLIASDIHGDATCCRAMLDAFKRENAEKILILGDILYHGPRNDLPEGYAPKKVIEMLNAVADKLICGGGCGGNGQIRYPIVELLIEGRKIPSVHGAMPRRIESRYPCKCAPEPCAEGCVRMQNIAGILLQVAVKAENVLRRISAVHGKRRDLYPLAPRQPQPL